MSIQKVVFALVLSMVAFAASAQTGADYTSITGAVDWASVSTGILAIGAALVGVLVAKRGVRLLLGMVGR